MLEEDQVLKLEEFLPYRLSVLSNTVSNAIADGYGKKFGLSIPSWRVMAILGRFPGISANELVEKTAMDKVAISRAVNKLIEQEFIERSFSEADKRRSILKLSPRGEEIYQQIVPLATAYEEHLINSLTGDQQQALDNIIKDLQKAAQSMDLG